MTLQEVGIFLLQVYGIARILYISSATTMLQEVGIFLIKVYSRKEVGIFLMQAYETSRVW